ncbi:MAG: nickel pincer cofactor biosynthesis protein LarC [Thermodesulfobacteriota bacterium]
MADIIYIDCPMGISGDMFLGAMIDMGVDLELIKKELSRLPIDNDEIDIRTSKETRHSITGTTFRVRLKESKGHRNYGEIQGLIKKSGFSPRVEKLSLAIFEKIAVAEGRVHNVPAEDVHFHEIGAIDSIVDIIGAAVAVDSLGNPAFFASPVALGTGMAKTMHGIIPIPAPATLRILEGVPTTAGPAPFELTTPTGAAILKTLVQDYGPMPDMAIKTTGYGAGKKDFKGAANLLRIIKGRASHKDKTEKLIVLETNLDDMTPELGGWLMERLLDSGALEVFYTEAQMKKSRPGLLLTVLADAGKKDVLLDIIFTESTTIGVRTHLVERNCLARTIEKVKTVYGDIRVKVSSWKGQAVNIQPEYEDCKKAALALKVPLKEIMDAARAASKAKISP